MPAPQFVSAGTYLTGGNGTSAAVAVPSGTAAGMVCLVHLYKENTATVTPPAGFTEVTNSPVATTTDVSQQRVFWKRLTAADAGTYSFTWSGNTWREAVATLWSGCKSSGDPTEIWNTATSGSTAVTASPSVSGTTNGDDRTLVWASTNFNGGGTVSAPSTFTGRDGRTTSGTPGTQAVASKEQAAAGSTGSITSSWNVSAVQTAFLIALIPDVPSGDVPLWKPPAAPGLGGPNTPTMQPWRGSGDDGGVVVSASAEAAEFAFAAQSATTTVAPVVGSAAVTWAANNASVKVSPSAGAATLTWAGQDATVKVSPTAQVAAFTFAAQGATTMVSPSVGAATFTFEGQNATTKVSPTAQAVTFTFSAQDATVSSSGGANPAAGNAAIAWAAQNATTKVSPAAGSAGITWTAESATAVTAVVASAGAAAIAWAAQNATAAVSVNPTNAAITWAANNATTKVSVGAQVAAITFTAHNATSGSMELACADFTMVVTLDAHTMVADVVDRHSATVTLDAHSAIITMDEHSSVTTICGRD